MIAAVLVGFAYHAFAALWLLRMSNHEKDVEILSLRHQLEVLHPAEIAGTVAFLLGPDARNITGQALVVCAGASLG